MGLTLGLTLIAIGSGGIKPCVSAHVGDQFGKSNQHLLAKVFGWFYFSINFGSALSTWLTPVLLHYYGPQLAFGLPGLLMFIATFVFWLGRRKFIHIPAGGQGFVRETFTGGGIKAALKLGIIFVAVAPFWSLFDQSGSAWVLQAEKMDRHWLGFDWLSSQIQVINPLLVMIMIPLFAYGVYPFLNRFFVLTPLRKITLGLFIAGLSFVVSANIEYDISGGDVVKYSSRSKIDGLSPTLVLDGSSTLGSWSSTVTPTPSAPQELVIRLRQQRAWWIESLDIDPPTELSDLEIASILEDAALKTLTRQRELKDSLDEANLAWSSTGLEDMAQQAQILTAAAQEAKKEARAATRTLRKNPATTSQEKKTIGTQAARRVALSALREVGQSTEALNDSSYGPQQVAFFAADLTDQLIPKLISELGDAQGVSEPWRDPEGYYRQMGWTHLGDLTVEQGHSRATLDFEAIVATHVLVHIKSNYGAGRVKIGEVRVQTSEPLATDAPAGAAEVWPNVAAIGYLPNIVWQLLAYLILTAAEVMVSITCLEFAYTQAPKKMKSFIMSLYLLSISLGNLYVSSVNFFIQNEDGSSKLPGANYYWLFAGMMLVTAVVFVFIAARYPVQDYIQDEGPEKPAQRNERCGGG